MAWQGRGIFHVTYSLLPIKKSFAACCCYLRACCIALDDLSVLFVVGGTS